MSEEYVVDAKLRLGTVEGRGQLNQVASGLTRIGRVLRGNNNALGSAVRSMVALGASYIGIRALSRSMRSFASSSLQANSSLEDMQVSLASVYAAVEQVSFARAQEGAADLFQTLNDMAVQSPATGAELMNIFQGVYGPLRAAGTAMDDLTRFTQNAASVGAALGVDYPQMSRDISAMTRGVAGLDNRTFSLLRSMGLITESTQEWNRMMPQESAARLLEIFEQLGGPAAEAFGATWTGASSTFRGIMQQFQRVFTGPTFERLRAAMVNVNTVLLENRAAIERVLRLLGERMASVFGGILERAGAVFTYVSENLDRFAAAIDTGLARLRELAPIMRRLATAFLVFKVVGPILGVLMSAMGSMLGMVTSAIGAAGAAGAGAGAAGAAAGAGGAGAALSAAWAAMAPVVTTLAGILAGLAAVAVVVWAAFKKHAESLWAILEPLGAQVMEIFGELWAILGDIWAFIEPIAAFVGAVLIGALGSAMRQMLGVFRVSLVAVRAFSRVLRWVGENVLGPILGAVAEVFLGIFQATARLGAMFMALARFIGSTFGISPSSTGGGGGDAAGGGATGLLGELRAAWNGSGTGGEQAGSESTGGDAPSRRAGGTNVDMRGSRITVNQEFREADPDRVWIQMRDGMEREAVQRTQSGFAPALSR